MYIHTYIYTYIQTHAHAQMHAQMSKTHLERGKLFDPIMSRDVNVGAKGKLDAVFAFLLGERHVNWHNVLFKKGNCRDLGHILIE